MFNKGAPGKQVPVVSSICGHLTEALEICKRRQLQVQAAVSCGHWPDDCWGLEDEFELYPAKEASRQKASSNKASPKKIVRTLSNKFAATKSATSPWWAETSPMKAQSPKAASASPMWTWPPSPKAEGKGKGNTSF